MPADDVRPRDSGRKPGAVRSPESLAGGILLVLLGCVGYFGTAGVPVGTLAEFGAGMVPRAVSVLVGLTGLALAALAFVKDGPALEPWPLRGLVCILGAVVTFGLTLRGFDFVAFRIPACGLVISGPLAITIASLADPETHAREIVFFSIGLTALCVVVFRFVLRLPIPIAPWLLGY